jgi:hypothetical protein
MVVFRTRQPSTPATTLVLLLYLLLLEVAAPSPPPREETTSANRLPVPHPPPSSDWKPWACSLPSTETRDQPEDTTRIFAQETRG